MRQFSFDTTFGVDELASASSQLLNVGVSTKVLQKDLKMLGDLAQGDKNKFQELTSIFAKVQSTGKVTSMQLQQLALRGVPILQTLKDMGVQGTASAEDLTKAFQKLTGEGGQFHNAMNNIIDTIEGKRGFITDTWKEILVNFGELSGLTEAYKNFLDVLYEVLNKLNNKLREWNENPVIKAIIRGTIKTALVAIVGVIVGSLIPALTTVVGLLGAINPTVWIGAGIGLLTGAIGSFISENKRLEDSLSGVTKVMEDAKQVIDDLGLGDIDEKKAKKNVKNGTASQEEKVVVALSKYTQAQTELLRMQKEINETDMTLWTKEEIEDTKNLIVEQEKRVNVLKSLLGFEKDALYIEQHRNDVTKMSREYFEQMEEDFNKWADSLGQVQSGNEELNKLLAEQADVESQINKLVENYNKEWRGITADGKQKILSLTDEQKKAFERDLNALKEKNKTLELQIKLEKAGEWQKELQKILGFDDETLGKLVDRLKSGGDVTREYVAQIASKYNQIAMTNQASGLNANNNSKTYIEEQAKALYSVYSKLLETGNFGWDAEKGKLDTTTQSLVDSIQMLRDKYEALGGNMTDFDKIINNVGDDLKEEAENIGSISELLSKRLEEAINRLNDKKGNGSYGEVGEAMSQQQGWGLVQGSDVGKFAESYAKYQDAEIALLDVLITDLFTIIGSLDNLDALLNPIMGLLNSLRPVLQAVVNFVSLLAVPLQLLFNAINDALKKMTWLTDWNNKMDKFYDDLYRREQEKKEKEKDLTSAYEKLLKAIRDQEEHYIKKQHELNMYAEEERAIDVNDMILTPNGKFSTNPKDTIIATKNPQSLGGVTNNIKVINNAGAQVDVQERKGNGINDIIVTISKKIASDVAEGLYGWDGAFALQQ